MSSELESKSSDASVLEAFEIANTNPTMAVLPLRVRIISFVTVCLAGLIGALCGYAIADLLATTTLWSSIGLILGGLFGAVGIGTVVQLGLAARPEWKASQKPTNSQP